MSDLEREFAFQLRTQPSLPAPVRQHRPLPPRRWTLDFAWPAHKVAVEVEGGVWVGGRHVRGDGYLKDLEKSNELQLAGWIALRVGGPQIEDLSALRWLARALDLREAAA